MQKNKKERREGSQNSHSLSNYSIRSSANEEDRVTDTLGSKVAGLKIDVYNRINSSFLFRRGRSKMCYDELFKGLGFPQCLSSYDASVRHKRESCLGQPHPIVNETQARPQILISYMKKFSCLEITRKKKIVSVIQKAYMGQNIEKKAPIIIKTCKSPYSQRMICEKRHYVVTEVRNEGKRLYLSKRV